MMDENMTMQPRVQILGAGISGLTLASCLRARQIPYQIFDTAASKSSAGHNYGITIASWGYQDLLAVLQPRLSQAQFRQAVAVDKLIGGAGRTTVVAATSSAPGTGDDRSDTGDIRASDTSLRALLSSQHEGHIAWSHRLSSATPTASGITLLFENGQTSTAPVTVDASGERSAVINALLDEHQKQQPEVLPYAVYHGSHFVPSSELASRYPDLFTGAENVREWSLPIQYDTNHTKSKDDDGESTSSRTIPITYYIQISRSYIPFTSLPSPIQKQYKIFEERSSNEPFTEIRYTISRPSIADQNNNSNNSDRIKDPIFNPNRSKSEAKNIPEAFYSELQTLLDQIQTDPSFFSSSSSSSSSSSNNIDSDKPGEKKPPNTIPSSLHTLLDPQRIRQDRVLNWLLRIQRTPLISSPSLKTTAKSNNLFVIGDAAHALPILGSQSANIAMTNGKNLGEFLADVITSNGETKDFSRPYDGESVRKKWEEEENRSKAWLRRVHGQEQGEKEEVQHQQKKKLDSGGGKL